MYSHISSTSSHQGPSVVPTVDILYHHLPPPQSWSNTDNTFRQVKTNRMISWTLQGQITWMILYCHRTKGSWFRNLIIGVDTNHGMVFKCIKCCVVRNNRQLIWWELETRKLIFEFRCVSSKSWQWTGIMSVAIARSERWMALQIVFDSQPSDLWR